MIHPILLIWPCRCLYGDQFCSISFGSADVGLCSASVSIMYTFARTPTAICQLYSGIMCQSTSSMTHTATKCYPNAMWSFPIIWALSTFCAICISSPPRFWPKRAFNIFAVSEPSAALSNRSSFQKLVQPPRHCCSESDSTTRCIHLTLPVRVAVFAARICAYFPREPRPMGTTSSCSARVSSTLVSPCDQLS